MATRTVEDIDVPAVNLILEAYNQADVGKYAEALAAIKAAKAADVRNIYVIALEKQFAKLLSLAPGAAADEARETLPPLLDRALDSARNNSSSAAAESSTFSSLELEEKEARLKELKNQYFTRADEYVERGDYQSALEEIKRVRIIDPANRIAREYETKIAQLATPPTPAKSDTLENETTVDPAPPREKRGGSPSKATVPSVSKSAPREEERPVVPASPDQAEVRAPQKKKSSVGLILGLAALVIAGGATAFYFLRPSDAPTAHVVPPQQTQVATPVEQTPADPAAQPSATAQENPPATVAEKPAEQNVSQPSPAVSEERSSAKEEKKSTPSRDESRQRSESSTRSQVSEPPKQESSKLDVKAESLPPAQSQQITAASPAQNAKTETAPPPAPFLAIERQPKVVKIAQPKIPSAAEETKQTGKVVVRVQIDPQGKPIKALIASSTNHLFDDSVIEAVMHSTFEPGMMSTGPVTTWMSIPFSFK